MDRGHPPTGEHHHALLPGLRVVPRGREHLQVGIEPSHAVRLERTPVVERALSLLTSGGWVTEDAEVAEVLSSLAAQALVVPSRLLTRAPTARSRAPAAGDLAALALADPSLLPERLERRKAARVGLVGTLGSAGADPLPLLDSAGLAICEDPMTAEVVLVAQVGELDRSVLDPFVRDLVPHVVLRVRDGVAHLGPFVVPGRTACLRCIDAHLSQEDPGLDMLVPRYAAATARPRADGTAEPVDSALAAMAVAWAVRDLVSHVDGLRPATWSSTVTLAPALASVTSVTWLRHPECGCAWSELPGEHELNYPSVTMEA